MLRPGGRAVVSAMHPAMFLRGSQAAFTDPATGREGAARAATATDRRRRDRRRARGLRVEALSEHAPDAAFAERYPRAREVRRLADAAWCCSCGPEEPVASVLEVPLDSGPHAS